MNPLLISFLLHALLLSGLSFTQKNKQQFGGDDGLKGNIAQNQPIAVEVVQKPTLTKEKGPGPIPKRPKTKACKEWYGGIGVYHNIFNEVISTVPGYPAHRIGLQPGDVIISEDRIDGEVGTLVTFQVLRNGELISYQVIREKICLE